MSNNTNSAKTSRAALALIESMQTPEEAAHLASARAFVKECKKEEKKLRNFVISSNSSNDESKEGNNSQPLSPAVKKQISPAKHWCFTINNPKRSVWDKIISSDSSRIPVIVMQEEVGENGTHHIQGQLSFKTKERPFNIFGKDVKAHWEKTREVADARNYCVKLDTRKEGTLPYYRGWRPPFAMVLDLRPWQQNVVDILNGPVDDRKIYWFHGATGGEGKSVLQKWIYCNMPGVVVVGGKSTDFKHGIASYVEREGDTPRIVLVNINRSVEQWVSYDGIESAKDAFFYSSKYEGSMVCGWQPHLICFANTPPDESKLSADRWEIRDLENEIH